MTVRKKTSPIADAARALIDEGHPGLSVRRQCELLGLGRSSYYYEAVPESSEDLRLMGLIDRRYTDRPSYGSRRMAEWLMRVMGLEAIRPKPRLPAGDRNHKAYPYLLRGVSIERADQVWSTDITYIGLPSGFMYLAAVIDWHSRYVLGWGLSNTPDGASCLDLPREVLESGKPEVFNTDQGVQFTAAGFVGTLLSAGVAVSTDGRGRCLDNIFVGRLWRSVKYEDVFIRGCESVAQLRAGLARYFVLYNEARRHQSLGYRTPGSVYRAVG